jgi:serine/threonine protein kinase/Tol biopolymer transport system component
MTSERWRQVEALFNAALEQKPDRREPFLAEACRGDIELRQEVESLLWQNGSNKGVLDRPAWEAVPSLIEYPTSLTPGMQLGPYKILAPIGAGGMGEVYRANDTRLGRDVAIKISTERFSERFEMEAHAIAALNHPNVCTLHDVGPNYLVMELVEGPTLAERIRHGPISLDEALAIAKQIAAALEAAHAKGITHRDLKPANINLKPDGTVKVLDFGLAKMGDIPASQSDNSPTRTTGPTQVGTILGTATYMAPEQACGKEVDWRADIWAFGVVLCEMLTAQKPFKGDDLSATLASVIKDEPKLERVPAKVQRLVRSCLEKDPKQRLQAIGDWRLLLEDQPLPKAHASKLPWTIAAALATVAAIALWAPWRSEKPTDRPLMRLDVDLGPDVSLFASTSVNGWHSVAISPDGMRLVYVSGTPSKLFTRRLDQPRATELPGTQGAVEPFFSPDGRWLGFYLFNGGKLNKISVDGGIAVPLAAGGAWSDWGEDGNILACAHGGLWRIPASGGPAEIVAGLSNGEIGFGSPQLLPGGKAVLFTAYTAASPDAASIEVMTLADRHRKTVARGTSPRYLATSTGAGHLVYTNKATLFAIPFYLDKLETRGTAVPILDDVAYGSGFGIGLLDFSRTGTLVYRRNGVETGLVTVAWIEGDGKTEPLLAKPGGYGRPSLSPDGRRLALDVMDRSGVDIWVYDWPRDTMTRLTFSGRAENAVWTPDGRYIVFRASDEGMAVIPSDGAGKPQPLIHSTHFPSPWSFTPDGKQMAFSDSDPKTFFDLWTVPLKRDGVRLQAGKPEVFLQTPASERSPALSPDGRWLAYASDESGTEQVYVRAFPDKGGKWQISNNGGTYPMWSRKENELFFETTDRQIMATAYALKGDSFVADKPRIWSERKLASMINGNGFAIGARNVDIAPDGKRLAALVPAAAQEAQQNEIVLLENFFDELRRRVPASK